MGCTNENKSGWLRKIFKEIQSDEKKEAIGLRKAANRLFFEEELSKSRISRMLDVSRKFVIKWTKSKDLDFTMDERGREKGERRKWNEPVEERILEIREELEEEPEQDYWGPTAVEVMYRKRYPDKEVPPLRTIGQMLKDLGKTKDQKHKTKRGALRYLHYPEKTVYEKLGGRVLEADFVGDKYLKGRSDPIRFIGYSFKNEPRLRHYERVEGETKEAFQNHTQAFFDRFESPDLIKVDNSSATIGSGYYKRTISDSMAFLLEKEVNPVFSVPRQPASQASIEGSNSLFSRKFWNRHEFEDLDQMEQRLEKFNENTRMYLQYEPPEEREREKEFEPVVYFLRQVREAQEGQQGVVRIMNEEVQVRREYIKFFVLGEWKLHEERLLIRFEERESESDKEEQVTSKVLKEREFKIHEASRDRCGEILK